MDFQIGASSKKSIDKKRNVYYRIDNKHLGIFNKLSQLKSCPLNTPILRPGVNFRLPETVSHKKSS